MVYRFKKKHKEAEGNMHWNQNHFLYACLHLSLSAHCLHTAH